MKVNHYHIDSHWFSEFSSSPQHFSLLTNFLSHLFPTLHTSFHFLCSRSLPTHFPLHFCNLSSPKHFILYFFFLIASPFPSPSPISFLSFRVTTLTCQFHSHFAKTLVTMETESKSSMRSKTCQKSNGCPKKLNQDHWKLDFLTVKLRTTFFLQ